MSQIAKIIDVDRGYLPGDPNTFPPNYSITAVEDSPEKDIPITVFEGYNFLPTSYGYRSYFGTHLKIQVDALTSKAQFIIVYQLPNFKNRLIALCEDGIWTTDPGTVDSPWTQAIEFVLSSEDPDALLYDVNVYREWTYCVIENVVYMYQQGRPVVWHTSVDMSIELAIETSTPTFLNMLGQIGIFKAGTRLGFWDSANSVAWSSSTNLFEFTPDVETLAGDTIFGDVKGRIVHIRSHGPSFIVYASHSIVGVVFDETSNLLWDAHTISDTVGISSGREVCKGETDFQHFVYTTSGIFEVSNYNPLTRQHKFDNIFQDIADFLREPRNDVALECVQARYLFIRTEDSSFIYGRASYRNVFVPAHDVLILGGETWTGDYGDLPPISSTQYDITIRQISEGKTTWQQTPFFVDEQYNQRNVIDAVFRWRLRWNSPTEDLAADIAAKIRAWKITSLAILQTAADYLLAHPDVDDITDLGTTIRGSGDALDLLGQSGATDVTTVISTTPTYEGPIQQYQDCGGIRLRKSSGESIVIKEHAVTSYSFGNNQIVFTGEFKVSGHFGYVVPGNPDSGLTASGSILPTVYDTLDGITVDPGPSAGDEFVPGYVTLPSGLVATPYSHDTVLVQVDGGNEYFKIQLLSYNISHVFRDQSIHYFSVLTYTDLSMYQEVYYQMAYWDLYRIARDGTTTLLRSVAVEDCMAENPPYSPPPDSHTDWIYIYTTSGGDVIQTSTSLTYYLVDLITTIIQEPNPTTSPSITVDPVYLHYDEVNFILQDGADAPAYPTYTGALVYDLQLKKWGKYKGRHKVLVDYQPVNTEKNITFPTEDLGIDAGVLDENGKIFLFDAEPEDGFVRYGKIGYSRLGFTNCYNVKVTFRSNARCAIQVDGSLDGKYLDVNTISGDYISNQKEFTLPVDLSARWYSISLYGVWDITSLEFRGGKGGRR